MDLNDMADAAVMPNKPSQTTPATSGPFTCQHSGIRLKTSEKPAEYIDSLVSDYKFVHCHYIALGQNPGEGVVVQKISPQTVDKKGNKFSILSISWTIEIGLKMG